MSLRRIRPPLPVVLPLVEFQIAGRNQFAVERVGRFR
jgi:hypothetical protein